MPFCFFSSALPACSLFSDLPEVEALSSKSGACPALASSSLEELELLVPSFSASSAGMPAAVLACRSVPSELFLEAYEQAPQHNC